MHKILVFLSFTNIIIWQVVEQFQRPRGSLSIKVGMNSVNYNKLVIFLGCLLSFCVCWFLHRQLAVSLPSGVFLTDLSVLAVYVCSIIFCFVLVGVLLYLVYYFNLRQDKKVTCYRQLMIDLVWTIIPFVMVVCLAIPAIMLLITN